MRRNYRLWNVLPYADETAPPKNGEEPLAGTWKLFYLGRNGKNNFTTPDGKKLRLAITDPNRINWNLQLKKVQKALDLLTDEEIKIAKYWGTGVATKQWTPVIDRLIDTYGVSAPRAARILAVTEAAINDAFIVCWNLKYKWLVARPNQLDQNLATILCTPRHPSYPSGHASVSGCAEEVLSYFFPGEKQHLLQLAEENALSRLYGGVHFPVDNDQGLSLGRQIGRIITQYIKQEQNGDHERIDIPHRDNRNADLDPVDFQQFITFDFPENCDSKVIGQVNNQNISTKPRLYI